MYEFHGWISSLEQPKKHQVEKIAALQQGNYIVESVVCNGSFLVSLAGCSNHDRNSDELISLFGSFENNDARGCLHIFDDEARDTHRSFSMVAGLLTPIALPSEFKEDSH